MKKYVLLAICITAAFGGLIVLSERHRYEESISLDSIIHIYNNGASCSGFIVGDDYAVTAKHCITNVGLHNHAVLSNGWLVEFKVEAQGLGSETADIKAGQDWALISLNTMGIPALEVTTARAPNMEFVAVVGHPQSSLGQYITYGVVGIYKDDYLQLSLQAYPGDSGSPVINERKQVVGILVRGSQLAPFSLATPVSFFYRELQKRGLAK